MESDKPPARTIFSPGSVLDVPAGRRLRPYPAGYCYLELFDVGDHDAARSLGSFPPVSALQAFVDSGRKCATDVLVRLILRVQDGQVVAHIQQSDKANAVRASLVLQALNGETLVGSDVSERSSVAPGPWWPGSLIGQVVQRHSASGGEKAPRGFCYLALFRESLWQEAMMLGPIPTVRTLQKFAREYADPWSVSDVNVTLHVEGERVLAHVMVDESDDGVPPMKVLDAIASYVRVGITLPRLRDNLASAWRSQYVGYLGSGRLDVSAVMSLNELFRCIVEFTEPGDPELGNGPSDPRMLAHRDLMVGTPTVDYAALPSGGVSLTPAQSSTAGDTGFCYLALFSQQHRSKAQQLGPLPTVADLRRFANAHKEPYSTRNVALAVHSKDGEAVAHIIEMQGTGLTAACALASLDKGIRVGVGEISVVKESTAGDVAVGPPLQLEVTPINKNEHTITLPIGGYLNADLNGMSIDPRIVPGLKRTFSIFESVRLLKFEMNVTVQGDASTMCRVAATTNSEPPVGNGGWITSPASMIMTGSMTGSTVNQFILPEDHQFGRELKAAFISNPPPIFHFYVTSNVPCHVMFRGLFTLQMAGRGNPTGIDFSKGLKYQMKSRHPRSVIREGQVEDESDDDDEEEAVPPSRAGRAAPAGAAAKSTQHTR